MKRNIDLNILSLSTLESVKYDAMDVLEDRYATDEARQEARHIIRAVNDTLDEQMRWAQEARELVASLSGDDARRLAREQIALMDAAIPPITPDDNIEIMLLNPPTSHPWTAECDRKPLCHEHWVDWYEAERDLDIYRELGGEA